MAARGFEYYGQTVAQALPPSQASTQAQPQAAASGHASDRLFVFSINLLVFAGALVVLGQLLAATPLGNVMADDASGLGVGIIAAGLVTALMVAFIVALFVKRVRK